jgi:PAS domain S-box-containing protein
MPNDLPPCTADACEARASILLVDDQPANLLALEAVLAELGHNLVRADSGEQALERLLEQDFAVVLLDVRMRGLDGFETAKAIRSRERSRHTPIIFLTAHDDNRLPVEEAYSLGAVDYLVKPLVPVILRAKVTGFVELFRKAEQIKQQAELLREMERRQFEQKLAEENARFRALTEHSTDAVALVRADGTVLYSSPSSRKVLGYEPDEFTGRSGFEVVHPDDLGRIVNRLAELVQTPGTPVAVELRVRHKDGSWRWVECIGTNLLAETAVRAVVVNFRDISRRRRALEALQESEQRFARFMQHLPGLAWIKDLAGRYVYANDAAEKAFQTPREKLYGRTDDEVFPLAVAGQFKENDGRALAGGVGVQVIETLQHADGVVHHSLVSKFPIPGPDGTVVLIGGMAIDITDRLRAEEELKEADRRKDEFLAMLAHELRNPLAPVCNALQILKLPGLPEQEMQEARDVIGRQVGQLSRLVDDLLDVSRITRGKITLRMVPVELTAVLARAVETSRPLIEANRHTFTLCSTPEPVWVLADPTRLEQVFTNLLNNSAKYTERGGSIRLTAERQEDDVLVRVRDTGFGIPAHVLPHVFELFAQADRTLDRSQGGLGIGLTLVKTLVELHGGTVTAHSEGPGQGSEFVVRLPISREAAGPGDAGEEGPLPAPSKVATPLRILVVDDNRDLVESLAILLRLWGHEVRTAHDGLSGLKAARSYRPQVVFLDIGLPGLDGYELARRLRAEVGGGMKLIAVTGYGQEEDRRRALEAGFDAHLVKPADLGDVQRLLGVTQPGLG